MKKMRNILALLACAVLAWGVTACSSDDDDDNGSSPKATPSTPVTPDTPDTPDTPSTPSASTTTDSWDFTAYANETWVSPTVTGTTVVKDAKYDTDGTYTISSDAAVTGAEGNLTLTVAATGTGKGATTKATSYSYFYGSTVGLRIKNDALKIANVKGDVVFTIEWYCIGGKVAGERNLELTIGDTGETQSIGIEATEGSSGNVKMTDIVKEISAGNGTNIYIGASNNVFIKKITITKQAGSFDVSTNSDTVNDLATLGLVGTKVESSDTAVATVALADGKIAITSVSAGDATITVTNKDEKTATIAATVRSSGEIAVGTITKFTRDSLTASVTKKATSETAKDGEATVTYDGLTDLEYSLDNETFASAEGTGVTASASDDRKTVTVTGLPAGTYYVRAAASDDYEATAAATVTVSYEGIVKTTDAWTLKGLTELGEFTIPSSAGSITADYDLAGDSGNLNLTFCTSSGVGKTKGGAFFKKHDLGTIIKKDALKIAGVKGSVKLTIKWGVTSLKNSSDRNLEVTVGATGTTTEIPIATGTKAQDDYVLDVEGGTDGVDIYIGASNELFIDTITIE